MKKQLQDLLSNQGENYIFPFFWQHGEDEETLRTYMAAIQEANIGAVAVESRPHPDFCGPQWFHDMDIILDEARKRGMKVWVLDMAHIFNGYMHMDEEYPCLTKQYLAKAVVDVPGPMPAIEIDVADIIAPRPVMGMPDRGMPGPPAKVFEDNSLVAVTAWALGRDNKLLGEPVDLTAQVEAGILRWDVPKGRWRVTILYRTRNGGGNSAIPNLLDRDSVRVILDKVYEPHYSRYSADFGKTFAGFFADEPMIGNTSGYNFDESIGRNAQMQLPWCEELERCLKEALGEDWARTLPRLWYGSDNADADAEIRYRYMDIVTRLVQKNFSEQIGQWCEAHGVDFVGHVIEDLNQHTRLGCGMGHYFRAISGQHMAGIDDIGGQVFPGGEDAMRVRPGDGSFYHYVLGKLASSAARILPKQRNRSLCEIFGAYGWQEGVREMKYLADHFLIRGVNYYVPHAFTPKAFPDPEFPPHFYAHGHNPQYRHFGYLMQYMNRICHLISEDRRVAPVALLYFAEAEWSGEYSTCDAAARLLTEHQIDFDILPADVFSQPAQFCAETDGQLVVNGNAYQALVIPGAAYLPEKVAQFAASGFPVVILDRTPAGLCEGGPVPALPEAVPTPQLIAALKQYDLWDIQLETPCEKVVYAHYRGDEDLYIFSNESVSETFSGKIRLRSGKPLCVYDAMDNVLRPVEQQGDTVTLTLEPCQLVLLISGQEQERLIPAPEAEGCRLALAGPWQVSFCSGKEYPAFRDQIELDTLENLGTRKPDFSGYMAYETTFSLEECGRQAALCLEHVFEGCQVWINGQEAGVRIAPPYRFDLSGYLRQGENTLRIEVANTLDRYMRRHHTVMGAIGGALAPIEAAGIFGEAAVYIQDA